LEFRKNSFNDEDSATLALVATMYQNVADEAISAGDSASFIISQMKAFNIEASNATHVIDAVNEVSNNFAVSSTDVATALTKTSSAMSVLGNDFEQTIGLVTAGTEIMTGQASKVARG
jgi:TP901 family phage tail tape measure protein